jgi:small GTP-binding protein
MGGGGKVGKGNDDHIYTKENTITPNKIMEAKVVLLGDSGVGKSSIA